MTTLPDPIDFVPALVSQLRSDSVADRRTASEMLKEAARDYPGSPALAPAVPALAEALDDRDLDVRVNVIWTIGFIGLDVAPALPAIGALVADEELCGNAFAVFDMIGPDGAPAVPTLMEILRTGSADARANAAEALGLIGTGAGPAVLLLSDALGYPDSRVRENAAFALGEIGAKAAVFTVPELIKALGDDDDEVLKAAMVALGAIGPAAASALVYLELFCGAEAERVRAEAHNAIRLITATTES
jgi:HEAT repeat protein